MKNNIENGIYIPSGNRELHTIDEWMQQAHPENAQTVVLVTDFGMLEIAKEDLPGGFNFEGAQKAAAEYRKGFRCPTRHEAIEMYDARFRGLDEALKKIGGKPVTTIGWTSEADPDPEYNSYYAFICSGSTGSVGSSYKHGAYAVRPVSAFKRNSFTVQSFPRPLRGRGFNPQKPNRNEKRNNHQTHRLRGDNARYSCRRRTRIHANGARLRIVHERR